jgi:hypothetical protein
MRGEFHAKHGRKLSMLRKLITPHLDFLILTETKAHPSALTRIKLRYGMKITHHSSHQQARKGVIIIAKPEHTIMEGSLRESGEPGTLPRQYTRSINPEQLLLVYMESLRTTTAPLQTSFRRYPT